jgi:maltose/maltodextrin transport system permease protein
MNMPLALKRFLQPVLMILLALAGLYVVTLVYATGESLLAGVMLVTLAAFIWIYTSPKTYAYRYLFPGIGAALIFVVFPMLYTIRIGFTNYSSKNLLTFPRATQYLLEEPPTTRPSTPKATAGAFAWRMLTAARPSPPTPSPSVRKGP